MSFPPCSIRAAVARLGDDWDAALHQQPFTRTAGDLRITRQAATGGPTNAYARNVWLASFGLSSAQFIDFIEDVIDHDEQLAEAA